MRSYGTGGRSSHVEGRSGPQRPGLPAAPPLKADDDEQADDQEPDLINTTQAALLVSTTVTVVSVWKARGRLEPAAYDERGRPLYRPRDVVNAERLTRQTTRKRGGRKRAVVLPDDRHLLR